MIKTKGLTDHEIICLLVKEHNNLVEDIKTLIKNHNINDKRINNLENKQ